MNQKKIMILGASQLQIPAIMKAKTKGLYVIALDMNKNAVGAIQADEFYNISTTDIEGIVKKASELRIDGIMTLATDMPMRAVAAVGEHLRLNTISTETAQLATDKARMRECLLKCNVPIPLFYSVSTYEEFESAVNLLKGDFIVKPADSSGSRGVNLIRDREKIKKAYQYSKSYSRSGEVLVEEYMRGPEVSVETITINGTTHIIAITDKETSGEPYFVERAHSIQTSLSENIKEDIKKVAMAGISALGINNSPAHTEIIITHEGAKIVEIGARLGGDNITTHLVPLATGVDMVGACIDLALGEIPDVTPMFNRGSAIKFISSIKGKIKDVEGLDEARKIYGVREVYLSKTLGDRVEEVKNSSDRIGFVIAEAKSSEEAKAICECALNKIKINII